MAGLVALILHVTNDAMLVYLYDYSAVFIEHRRYITIS